MGEGELISANKLCAVAFLNSVQWSKGGELWWNLKLDSQLIFLALCQNFQNFHLSYPISKERGGGRKALLWQNERQTLNVVKTTC